MSDVTEGIGAAIEGGLAGRAIEPGHGETRGIEGADRPCLNCGAEPKGSYCQVCGQKRHIHRTLSAIGHDLIHGVLHLDGKFWRTLPMLMFKPGKLTRRYIEGERAKFVSPMAMFLFSVFAMFAIFQMVGISTPTNFSTDQDVTEAVTTAHQDLIDHRDALRTELRTTEPGEARHTELEGELATAEAAVERFEQAQMFGFGDDVEVGFQPTGFDWFDEGIAKKWRENPSLMLYKLQANGYKFSWLLIPLSIPFVWLIFAWKRRFKAYDHAIFVTYSLAFMSLLFIVASILGSLRVPTALIVLPLLSIPPIHLYKQLRGTYEIGRLSAIWRLLALSVFIWIVIGLFVQALIVLGAF